MLKFLLPLLLLASLSACSLFTPPAPPIGAPPLTPDEVRAAQVMQGLRGYCIGEPLAASAALGVISVLKISDDARLIAHKVIGGFDATAQGVCSKVKAADAAGTPLNLASAQDDAALLANLLNSINDYIASLKTAPAT